MPFTVTPIPVPAPDEAPGPDVQDLVEVERRHHRALFGHEDLVHGAGAVVAGLTRQESTRRQRLLARDHAGAAVGAAHVTMPLTDNQHLGLVFLNHDPGSGTVEGEVYDALWAVADATLLEAGRTSVLSWAAHPAPVDPAAATWLTPTTGSGQVAQDDRARWFAARGFVLEQVELYSVLDLAEVDEGRLRAAEQGGRAAAPGGRAAYRTRTWQGATPPELRAGMARLRNRMSTDTPTGGIDYGEEAWDEAEVAALDERHSALGTVRLTTVALDPSGAPVAYTELDHDPDVPAGATQDDTLVHAEHRGHGLGLRVKATNLLALREAVPTVERVHTWNAAENTHMLAINTSLGFREAGSQGGWQLRR